MTVDVVIIRYRIVLACFDNSILMVKNISTYDILLCAQGDVFYEFLDRS